MIHLLLTVTDASLRSTAIHEAAHAVVATALGAAVGDVTIRRSAARGGASGHCEVSARTPPLTRAIIAAAGEPASARIVDFDQAMHGAVVDRRDVDMAVREYFATFATPSTMREQIAMHCHIVSRAEALVDENWEAIERVADELLEEETLTGDEVRKIITGRYSAATRTAPRQTHSTTAVELTREEVIRRCEALEARIVNGMDVSERRAIETEHKRLLDRWEEMATI